MNVLFRYPSKAKVDQIIPKVKIYEHARPKALQKAQFIEVVQRIKWAYKLAPETTNLAASKDVKEIQIIQIWLSQRDLSDQTLALIDNSIPSSVIFELAYAGQVMLKAAYKRRRVENSKHISLSDYFASDWVAEDILRGDLPQAIDLGILYGKILSGLMNPCVEIDVETSSLVDKLSQHESIKIKEAEVSRIERKLARAKQFNKRVDIRRSLKKRKNELNKLKKAFTKLEIM